LPACENQLPSYWKVNETGPVNLAAMFFRIGENVMKIMLPRSLIVLRLCCFSLQLPFFPKAFCATHLQRIFGIPEDTRNWSSQGSPLFSVQQVKEHFKPVKQSVESQPCLLGLLCKLHGIEICPILVSFSSDLNLNLYRYKFCAHC